MNHTKFNKIGESLIKIVICVNKKRKVLIASGIFVLLYSILHEYNHYLANYLLGYSGKITWGLLKYDLLLYDFNRMSIKHYFLITLSPYIFSLILLAILFILNQIFPKYNISTNLIKYDR